jgi:tryptophan 2,3-dioxygenase
MTARDFEDGIHVGLEKGSSYGDYLELDLLLKAQTPRTEHHDEMLFIIQHQTSDRGPSRIRRPPRAPLACRPGKTSRW